ncbi:MAG: hypothetical protein COY40_03195 [Alphaproteobacteria bacterium CG_4_10_14_0_8_um_filter_53_9]|nr:MAG: hypothetical protein COY40_03195 [Alphaproteobacteria bacterium CG_4_10_14_0_8_um_filter_53_9]
MNEPIYGMLPVFGGSGFIAFIIWIVIKWREARKDAFEKAIEELEEAQNLDNIRIFFTRDGNVDDLQIVVPDGRVLCHMRRHGETRHLETMGFEEKQLRAFSLDNFLRESARTRFKALNRAYRAPEKEPAAKVDDDKAIAS